MRLFRKQIDVIGFGLLLAVLVFAALKMSALNVREAAAGDSTLPPPNLFLPAIFGDATSDTDSAPTGAGVTVVILDRGIDWRHPDFLNPDGSTRIKWILDMTGQTNWCAPGQPEPVEYSEADINAALQDGMTLPHRDAVGHGTATAGMAAGNGSALPGAPYAGVAPEADLVIVKLTSEGAPAHGSVPAEAPINGCLDDALDWVDEKIDALGQPAVALWNAGTQWGPIDGTSAASRKIAEVFGAHRPGRVWVVSSGDEGSLPNHAGGQYGSGEATEVPFDNLTAGASYLTVWYSGDAPANVSIRLPGGATVGPVAPGESVTENGVTIIQYVPGNEFYPWTSTSGDRAVWISISGNQGEGAFLIEGTSAIQGRFDLYGDLLGPTPLTPSIEFLDLLAPGRLNDVSATEGAIVVGVHVARDSYTDINGIERDFSHEGVAGDLWLKSSGGPTRDGRDVMAVTAEGQNAFASLAQDSHWSTLPANVPMSGEGQYVRFGGTSAAGPIVVGTVALMLEVNPDLTGYVVQHILQQTATSDAFTGPVPNDDWGYGKLNIEAAVQAAEQPIE